jgi:hypothetical protein
MDGASRAGPSVSGIAVAISDERYSDSRRFAAALHGQGAQVFTSEPDLVHVWRNALAARVNQRDFRIAGLTTHNDFEVMRICAREAGLKVSYEATHDCRGSEHLVHQVRQVKSGVGEQVIAPLREGRSDWVEALAFALARNASLEGVGAPGSSVMSRAAAASQAPRRSADHPGFLTSWLIGVAGVA